MQAPATVSCGNHRRREAVATCVVCGGRLCADCVVSTSVGVKCGGCSGTSSPTRRGRRRWPAVVAAAGVLVAGVAGYGLLRDEGSPPPPAGEAGAVSGERSVQITGAGGFRLGGTLQVPEAAGDGPVPGVLILPTFGPTDRNGISQAAGVPDRLYQELAQELAGVGMASFRYDKRGTGQAMLPASGLLRFDDLVADARAAITFLAERREVDPEALAVVGHGEGGLVAMRLAVLEPKVKGLVLLSTPGRPLVDVISDDFRVTHGPASANGLRAMVDGLLGTGSLPSAESLPSEHRDFFPRDQIPYVRDIFSIDPMAEARRVSVPTLIVRGGRASFASAADADRLAGALGSRAEVVVAPEAGPTLALPVAGGAGGGSGGGGHDHDGSGAAGIARDEAAMNRISGWLGAHVGARDPKP